MAGLNAYSRDCSDGAARFTDVKQEIYLIWSGHRAIADTAAASKKLS
jgi:hypothetical protein